MEQFTAYSKFLELRKQLIDNALSNAVFSEKRDGERVRPVVRITAAKELTEINKLIAKWQVLADQLCDESPHRFNRSSVIFSPEPKVLYGLSEANIIVNEATSTRKINRDDILRRLRKARTAEKISSGKETSTAIARLDREISFFKAETEETYRLRSEGYTEILLLIRSDKDVEFEKIRVPFAGIFIFDPNNSCKINQPQSTKGRNRGDKVKNLGVKAVRYSLVRRCRLFRISDLENAKLSAVAERNQAAKEADDLTTAKK
jgi:hypothetical protein